MRVTSRGKSRMLVFKGRIKEGRLRDVEERDVSYDSFDHFLRDMSGILETKVTNNVHGYNVTYGWRQDGPSEYIYVWTEKIQGACNIIDWIMISRNKR